MRKLLIIAAATIFVVALTQTMFAQAAGSSDSERMARLEQEFAAARSNADSSWMLVSSALVLMMTGPGLALFYGGLVRKKNVLFATNAINPVFKDAHGLALPSGLLEGNFHQLGNQAVGVAIAWIIAGAGTWLILKAVDLLMGLRVSAEHELQGLDLTQHGEEAYSWEASLS